MEIMPLLLKKVITLPKFQMLCSTKVNKIVEKEEATLGFHDQQILNLKLDEKTVCNNVIE